MTAASPTPVGRLSKSLMTTPCQRKGWYAEHVRDQGGYKIKFAVPEKVVFGSAVDGAHLEIVYAASRGNEPDLALAIEKGMERARRSQASEPIDWDVFEVQLGNSMKLFLSSPDGLARIPLDGIRFQGIDGEAMTLDDMIILPDYLLGDGSVLDVKATARRYGPTKFWRSAEMPLYAYLASAQEGVLPPKLIYQTYVRVTKPYWDWIETPGLSALVTLGKQHAAHWRALLTGPVEMASFDTTYCIDCGFRNAIPEVGFGGCEIGQTIPVSDELEVIAA